MRIFARGDFGLKRWVENYAFDWELETFSKCHLDMLVNAAKHSKLAVWRLIEEGEGDR